MKTTMSAYLNDTSNCLTGSAYGYGDRLAEVCVENSAKVSPVPDDTEWKAYAGNVGRENGSVVGCNSNNSNASARTENCNNNAGNGNDNYAGTFAVENIYGKRSTTCAASIKITEGSTATGALGQCDYGLPPFCEDWELKDKAESSAIADNSEEDEEFKQLMKELKTANSKRKLKNLKRFFTDIRLIYIAFDRTLRRSSTPSRIKREYVRNREKFCRDIQRKLEDQTYVSKMPENRLIEKKGKGDKNRNAKISAMEDRIIYTLILIVIEHKFRKKFIRNIYSGIEGRSLFSNNRRYCMINKIRDWNIKHPKMWVGLTDISKFYESLEMKIVLGVLFKTIVCPYTRWLLVESFKYFDKVPIGCSLSQLMAMIAIQDADIDVLKKFNVSLFCFGDNRLIGGEKAQVRKAIEYYMSYYEGAYNLHVKGDYQMRKVSDGYRFCKYDYKGSYVSIRSELKRRSIRAFRKGLQHYAGYKGMLLKTDSKRLRYLIDSTRMNIVNKHGMTITTQRGDRVKYKDLPDDASVIPFDFEIKESTAKRKEGKTGYYVEVTYIHIRSDGSKRLCHSQEGSEEIVEFHRKVERGEADNKKVYHIGHSGTQSYYKEFHTTKEEACALICEQLGI